MHCFTGGLYQPIASLSLLHAVVFVNTRCAIMTLPVDLELCSRICNLSLFYRVCVLPVFCAYSQVYSIVLPDVKFFVCVCVCVRLNTITLVVYEACSLRIFSNNLHQTENNRPSFVSAQVWDIWVVVCVLVYVFCWSERTDRCDCRRRIF